MPIYCPSCKKDDRIKTVSAAYSEGISHGTFSGSEGPVSGTSQTVLSGKLAPLPKPTIPCFVIGCSAFWVVIGAVGIVYLFLLARIFDSPDFLELFGGLASSIGSIFLFFGLGVGIYLVASLLVRSKMPQWNAAMQVWNRCYYCDRDGIVFDPINTTSIPVDNFNDYLKKSAPSPMPTSDQKSEEQKVVIKCENCGQKLSIPLRRKNLHVTCPKCRHEFNYEYVEGHTVDD